jgi:hypothetical protein
MEGVSGVHVACCAALGLVMPLAARIAGSEAFAYTMFSETTTYSLEIVATDEAGERTRVSPSSLAPSLSPAAGAFVSGTERPRRARSVGALRVHLADLAQVACARSGARAVDLALVEHADDEPAGAPARRTEAHAACR